MCDLHFIRIILAAAQTMNWREARLEVEKLVGKVVAAIQTIHNESPDYGYGNRSGEKGLN